MSIITSLPLPFISQRMGHKVDGLKEEKDSFSLMCLTEPDVVKTERSVMFL